VDADGDLDIAKDGWSIEGLGHGSLRPDIRVGTAVGANVEISADNLIVHNVRITGRLDAITAVCTITGDNVQLLDVEYADVTGQCVLGFVVTGDDVVFANFRYKGATAAGSDTAITLNAADRFWLYNFDIDGDFANAAIECITTASSDIRIWNGNFRTRNSADAVLLDTITASTGTIGPNITARVADNAANVTEAFSGATFVYHQPISIVNLAGEVGLNTNITATTDA